jgi:hypothetical protein
MKDADRKVIVETTLRNFDLRPTYPRKGAYFDVI